MPLRNEKRNNGFVKMNEMDKKEKRTETQQKRGAIAVVVLVAVFSLWIMWVVGRPLIRYASEPERFRQWIDGYGIWGPAVYMGCVILQVLVAFIPGEPLELVAGYAFGSIQGTLLCLIASSIGSVLVFGLVRRFGIKLVNVFYSEEKLRELRFLKHSKKRDILYAVIFILPGTPKDLQCYFAGLTDMKFTTFLLICSLGRIPSILTSTASGDALGKASYIPAVIILCATLLISGGGIILYRHICKKHNREPLEHLKTKMRENHEKKE